LRPAENGWSGKLAVWAYALFPGDRAATFCVPTIFFADQRGVRRQKITGEQYDQQIHLSPLQGRHWVLWREVETSTTAGRKALRLHAEVSYISTNFPATAAEEGVASWKMPIKTPRKTT